MVVTLPGILAGGSDYFKVLKSWPRGRVAANKIIVNFDHGSVAVWLRNP